MIGLLFRLTLCCFLLAAVWNHGWCQIELIRTWWDMQFIFAFFELSSMFLCHLKENHFCLFRMFNGTLLNCSLSSVWIIQNSCSWYWYFSWSKLILLNMDWGLHENKLDWLSLNLTEMFRERKVLISFSKNIGFMNLNVRYGSRKNERKWKPEIKR